MPDDEPRPGTQPAHVSWAIVGGHRVVRHKAGTVAGLTAAVGQTVTAGEAICDIKDD